MKRRKPRSEEGPPTQEEQALVDKVMAKFLEELDRIYPPTPRQRAERQGLRVLEGGKTK